MIHAARRTLLGASYLALGAALAAAVLFVAVGGVALLVSSVGDGRLDDRRLVGGGAAVAAVLILAVGVARPVRQVEAAAVESMLVVEGVTGDASTPAWGDRLRSATWLALHIAAGAVVVGGLAVLPAQAGRIASALVPLAILAVVLGGAAAVRGLARAAPGLLGPSARERVERLEDRARELSERNRLAREIHDSLGHPLGIVAVHAAAARRVHGADPGYVVEALGVIEAASRRATAELDHVIGMLRDQPASRDGARTERGLRELPELVASATKGGLPTSLDDRLTPAEHQDLSPVTGRELYRIAQESVANALRHGSGPCELVLERAEARVRLVVHNRTDRTAARARRRGSGLSGIAERTATLGGRVTIGPDENGWRVAVELPWVSST